MITVDMLLDYYKCKNDAALAKRCQVTRSAVSQWRSRGIHQNTQAVFQVMSKDKLKAATSDFTHLAKTTSALKSRHEKAPPVVAGGA